MPTAGGLRVLRLISAVLLAGCVLRVWHILVMRLYLDEPGVVAMWLAGTVALVLLARRPSKAELVFVGLFAVLVFLFHWGYERAASDGREYFVQVRSLVMDRDLNFANEDAVLGTRGTAKMYPFGAAILWAPFMVLAHLWLSLLNLLGGTHAVDGFTNPYQRAIGLGTLMYGCIGLLLMWRMLRDYFDEAIAVLATIGITAGTFFLWYLTVENSMIHGVSLFATMLFVYVWHRGRPGRDASGAVPSIAWWVTLGLTAGVMTLVRWQNITFVAFAALASIWPLRRAGWPAVRGVLVSASVAFAAFLPQLIFWQVVRGDWMSLPAADHGFDLRSLHIADVLFSPNHGLLSTTPLVYIAVLGLPLFFRRDVPMAIVLVGGFITQVIVNSGNDGWWGGPSFGARRFDNCLMVFAVGLASLIVWLRRRPLVAPMLVLVGLIGTNLALMVDVRNRTLPSAGAITVTDFANSIRDRVGNPFSFPYNAYVGWRFDADWSLYDRLEGRTYSNIEIDLGDTGDEMFLGRGWLAAERSDSLTFRWAGGAAANIVVPLRAPAHYQLELVCSPFEFAGSPRQTIDVTVNRVQVAQIVLQPGLARYQVDIPVSAWRSNLNVVHFVFGYSVSPSDMRVSNDPRRLAVMFDSLRLRQRVGDAP